MINKKFTTKYFTLSLVFLLSIILSFGCNNIPQRPQENEEGNSPPDLPQVLEEMEEEILNTIYDIDALKGISMAIAEKEDEMEEEPSHMDIEVEGDIQAEISVNQEEGNGGGNGGGGNSSGSNSSNDLSMVIEETAILHTVLQEEEIEGSATAGITEPPDTIANLWSDIHKQIDTLHRQWNVLEADLRDVNVPQGDITDFEETLNDATLSALDAEDMETLYLLNTLTKHLANFRNVFDDRVPGNVYKMRYHIRHSLLLASEEEYQDAQEHINETKEIKNALQKELLEKGKQNTIHKFDLSIEDLERQLSTENLHLIQTEAAIVMKNIILIEDVFKGSME